MEIQKVQVVSEPYERNVSITLDGGRELLKDISYSLKWIVALLIFQFFVLLFIAFHFTGKI